VPEGLRFKNLLSFGSHVVVTLCGAGGSDSLWACLDEGIRRYTCLRR